MNPFSLAIRCALFAFTLAAVLGAARPVFAQNPSPNDFKDYVYKTADGKPLQLSVFPATGPDMAKAPLPVIIMFHGGGWMHGDRKALYTECRYFAKRGIVAVTADYRFLDRKATDFRGTPDICMLDTKSAIRWVRSHASELGIDPRRVILCGGSAGGELATMAHFDTTVNDPQDDTSIPTTCVAFVLFNPAYFPTGSPTYAGIRMDPKLEPYDFVSAQVPPMIMFFGTNDPLEKNAELFVKPCLALGVKAQIWLAPGQKHSFFNKPDWLEACCEKADPFLVSLGLLQAPSTPLPAPPATLVPGPGAS